MEASLAAVAQRFPIVQDQASRLFQRDETFREICEEYQACADTLSRLGAASPPTDPIRQEYSALLLRLERELLRYLEEHPNHD